MENLAREVRRRDCYILKQINDTLKSITRLTKGLESVKRVSVKEHQHGTSEGFAARPNVDRRLGY